jgi:hypothetical protein
MRHLSFANVVASLALFIALGGSAYAAIKIRGKDVVNGSLTGADIRNGSIGTADVAGLRAADFAAGQLPQGAAGPAGPAGAAGPAGSKGDTGEKGERGDPGADALAVALPGARAHSSVSSQPFTGTIDNEIPLDAEAYDVGGMYDPPNDFLTIRRAGTYVLTGHIAFNGGGSERQVRLVVNGSLVEIADERTGTTAQTMQVTTTRRLQVGDKVALGRYNAANATAVDFGCCPDVWLSAQFVSP